MSEWENTSCGMNSTVADNYCAVVKSRFGIKNVTQKLDSYVGIDDCPRFNNIAETGIALEYNEGSRF